MARPPREKSATGYYHIMMRGNNREYIYRTIKDKQHFLQLIKEEESLHLMGYCLMDNHVHLVLKAQIEDLSKAIKKINVKYAMHYNFHKRRVGHVFQNRYKSEVIHTDPYLTQVIRYIHYNPVRAGMIFNAEEYPWSSYKEYLGKAVIIAEHQKNFLLNLFSGNTTEFINFHQQKDDQEYLDTREEVEQNRINQAQAVITEFCNEKGIFEAKQIKNDDRYLEGIIQMLLDKTKLSHRKIAQLLEVNRNTIHQVAKKQ